MGRIRMLAAVLCIASLAGAAQASADNDALSKKTAKEKTENFAKGLCKKNDCSRSKAANCSRLSDSKVACDALVYLPRQLCTTRLTWATSGSIVLLFDAGKTRCKSR